MKLKQYCRLAERTEADPITVSIAGVDAKDIRALHAAMGLVTEAGELLEIFNFPDHEVDAPGHIEEEVGDLFWYVAVLINSGWISGDQVRFIRKYARRQWMDDKKKLNSHELARLLSISAASLMDALKKRLWYGKALESEEPAIINILEALFMFCCVRGLDRGKILDANIAKLKLRYPEKFDQHLALNRDVQGESVVFAEGSYGQN